MSTGLEPAAARLLVQGKLPQSPQAGMRTIPTQAGLG